MICMFSRDLMSASTVRAAAENLKLPFRLVQSLDDLRAALCGDAPIQTVVIDLQTGGFELADLATVLQTAKNPLRTIAFAQHVQPQLLKAAREHVDKVLTRGQFLGAAENWIAPNVSTDDLSKP